MAGDYSGTALPFDQMELPDLRDPVLRGPGHQALHTAIAGYYEMADELGKVGDAIRSVLNAARDAHQGGAAEAGQRALATLAVPGDTGAQQAKQAAQSLVDQAGYVARVRTDMQASDPGPTMSVGEATVLAVAAPLAAPAVAVPAVAGYIARHAARDEAARSANLYQSNTNWNLDTGFQAFPAPNGPTPDTSQGAAGTPGGAGSAFRIGPAGAVGGGPVGGGGSAVGTGSGAGTGGSAAGLIPVVPGGSTAGGADTAGGVPGSGAPEARAGGTGGAGVGGAGSGAAGTGAAGAGGVGSGGVGSGRVGPGGAGTGSATRTPGLPVGPGRGGGTGPAGLGPQAYRPGGRSPAGTDPESGILSGAPPLPGNGVISPRDPSGTDRGTPAWGNAVADGRIDRAPLDRPAPPPSGPTGRGAAPGQGGGMPFMGGAGAGRDSDHEHRRPSWLVQEDPDDFWFSGLPAHSDPVITPDADG